MTSDNFCFYLQNRLIQTSQTGGQWYSDTSPFSIPWSSVPIRQRGASRQRKFETAIVFSLFWGKNVSWRFISFPSFSTFYSVFRCRMRLQVFWSKNIWPTDIWSKSFVRQTFGRHSWWTKYLFCQLKIWWTKYLSTKCYSTKCLLTKCHSTKCLLTKCHSTKCLSMKCPSTKCWLMKCPSTKCL